MLIAAVAVTIALVSPPTEQQLEVRRARVGEIQQLADSERAEDVQKLIDLVSNRGRPVWERLTALKSLGDQHRRPALDAVEALADDGPADLRTEAAILSYRWQPSKEKLKRLEGLRDKGANLRRAFQSGEERGRPTYRKEAGAFLQRSLEHPLIYTRLDGALGLVEIGEPPHKDRGISAIREALSSTDVKTRLIALRYLAVPFSDPALDTMLEAAAEDPDPRVRAIATQIRKD